MAWTRGRAADPADEVSVKLVLSRPQSVVLAMPAPPSSTPRAAAEGASASSRRWRRAGELRAPLERRARGIDAFVDVLDEAGARLRRADVDADDADVPDVGPVELLQAVLDRFRGNWLSWKAEDTVGVCSAASRTSASSSARLATAPRLKSSSSRPSAPVADMHDLDDDDQVDADDAALGQGPRVPGRALRRGRGGCLHAHPGARSSRTSWRRKRRPPLLFGHPTCPGAPRRHRCGGVRSPSRLDEVPLVVALHRPEILGVLRPVVW